MSVDLMRHDAPGSLRSILSLSAPSLPELMLSLSDLFRLQEADDEWTLTFGGEVGGDTAAFVVHLFDCEDDEPRRMGYAFFLRKAYSDRPERRLELTREDVAPPLRPDPLNPNCYYFTLSEKGQLLASA